MTNAELTTKLAELEHRIIYLEKVALRIPKANWMVKPEDVIEGFPFGTWKEYPPTQAAPQADWQQAYTDQITPSYHCTYEHP